MTKQKHSYPTGFASYTGKILMRRGVALRYVPVKNVIWLVQSDIAAHYKQLKEKAQCVKR